MKAWRVHQLLARWPRFYGLAEAEQSKLVELVQSLIAEAKKEQADGFTEAEHELVARALFMFGAHLTTLPKHRAVQFSAVHNASPAVELIEEFANIYGVSIANPNLDRFVRKTPANSIGTPE